MKTSEVKHNDFRVGVAYYRAILKNDTITAGVLLNEFSSPEGSIWALTVVASLLAQMIDDVDSMLAGIAAQAATEQGTGWPD